ncbi:hypothetical protein D3C76_716290 [compost metagenome]
MGAAAGAAAQGLHQLAEIARADALWFISLAHAAKQAAEGAIGLGVIGHQQILVARMKAYQRATVQALGQQVLPVGVGVNAAYEVLAQHGVMQAAFFFYWQVRAQCAESLGIDAAATMHGRVAVVLINLYPFQAA